MMNLIYKYILKFSEGKSSVAVMALVSFTEALFFLIPPDPFLGVLCINKKNKKIIELVLICLFSSIIGGCLAYLLGEEIVIFAVKNDIGIISNNLESIEAISSKLKESTFLLMITSGFTPLPFKLFCISAGILNVDFIPFLFGSIIGRGLRFALVGYLAKIFGDKFEAILKSKEVFYISIGLIALLIIYLIIKWT